MQKQTRSAMLKFETELSIALRQFLEPLITNCVEDALKRAAPAPAIPIDTEPYGDFTWLTATCSGIPASTLRGKSAAGEIPGLKKVGKRVLYHKTTVLDWLNGQTRPAKPTAEELNQTAENQFNTRHNPTPGHAL